MQIINYIDESHRLYDVKYFHNSKTEQNNSHGYRYFYCRNEYKKMGQHMGFDKMFEAYDNSVAIRQELEDHLTKDHVPENFMDEYLGTMQIKGMYDDYLKKAGLSWSDVMRDTGDEE